MNMREYSLRKEPRKLLKNKASGIFSSEEPTEQQTTNEQRRTSFAKRTHQAANDERTTTNHELRLRNPQRYYSLQTRESAE
jgi:hypothetical protein